VVGSAVGVLLILLAGTVCVDSVDGVDGSYCGLNLLVWNVRMPVGLALAGGLGASRADPSGSWPGRSCAVADLPPARNLRTARPRVGA